MRKAREVVRDIEIFSGFLFNFSKEVSVNVRVSYHSPLPSLTSFLSVCYQAEITSLATLLHLSLYLVSGFQGHLCIEEGWNSFLFLNCEVTHSLFCWSGTHSFLLSVASALELMCFGFFCYLREVTRLYGMLWKTGLEEIGPAHPDIFRECLILEWTLKIISSNLYAWYFQAQQTFIRNLRKPILISQ